MMHQMYTDYLEGQFIPQVTVTKRDDNGHFEASSCGITITHHDQAEAINRLTAKIHDGLADGTIHPNM
jgi:hypothetical protein